MSEPQAMEVSRGWRLTGNGLEILRPLSSDEWRRCGRRLLALANGTAWAIGDWFAYGTTRRGDYGKAFTQMADATGKSFESLSQYARVSRAYPPGVRRPDVPWSLHRDALVLPETVRLQVMAMAADECWTTSEMRAHIDKVQRQLMDTYEARPQALQPREQRKLERWRKNPPKWLVRCPRCGHKIESRKQLQEAQQ